MSRNTPVPASKTKTVKNKIMQMSSSEKYLSILSRVSAPSSTRHLHCDRLYINIVCSPSFDVSTMRFRCMCTTVTRWWWRWGALQIFTAFYLNQRLMIRIYQAAVSVEFFFPYATLTYRIMYLFIWTFVVSSKYHPSVINGLFKNKGQWINLWWEQLQGVCDGMHCYLTGDAGNQFIVSRSSTLISKWHKIVSV